MKSRKIGNCPTGVLVLLGLALAGSATPAAGQGFFDRPVGPDYCGEDDARIEVLLLGSFHMAKRLGHETIHPIDFRLGLDFDALNAVVEQDPALGSQMQKMEAMGEEAIGQGHIPILRQLVIDHPHYCLEDPLSSYSTSRISNGPVP